jgi:hypothetical protein
MPLPQTFPVRPCYGSKHPASCNARGSYPEVEGRFRPVRDWHGADVATLTDQVYDRPVPLTDLDIIEFQAHQLGSA